jgi:hypothetical protein
MASFGHLVRNGAAKRASLMTLIKNCSLNAEDQGFKNPKPLRPTELKPGLLTESSSDLGTKCTKNCVNIRQNSETDSISNNGGSSSLIISRLLAN